MLSKVKTLTGYKLEGRDGEIGRVHGFYFDDRHWTVRYLVAESDWLTGRQVLISPYALLAVHSDKQTIAIDLTKKQIADSPSLETDKPVSRKFEGAYYGYFGWPTYWTGPSVWGAYPHLIRDRKKWDATAQGDESWDPNLRSTNDVSGLHVQASDGEIGHVEDFIIDDETWVIRYLVIDTRNWWPGKRVLVAPQWIERVKWNESKVFFNLSLDAIKKSPEYTEATPPTRDYESALHQHYDRRKYWIGDETVEQRQAARNTKQANR
ncbi:MAG: photosystem reaction center subunit H [Deltaproteobacteria bacterium RIFOXYA12_FULL_58_15]|nr:MAG: photosystem reaction center subunit H [Deltaproteobacteria bacterium RIFOXYA12_FULL_58_15]OGR07315.1 MAG: photosystem reaction center subunit H [Deltaproteobacteria bacterium RIFOXYB12_FULL_58_9]